MAASIKKEKNLNNEKGQAIFEFILFLPFLILLFTIMSTVGNSINGSINQQKATRAYFFNLTKGNSFVPNRKDLTNYKNVGNFNVGMAGLGWIKRLENRNPVAPCYKLNTFYGSEDGPESCDEPTTAASTTRFIKVFTYFGLCGESYTAPNSDVFQEASSQKGFETCKIDSQTF